MLTRDQILNADDIKQETVNIPEWGGSVIVRGLSGKQRDEYQMYILEKRGNKYEVNFRNATVKLCLMTVIAEDGKPLFEIADLEGLAEKSGKALNRIYDVATRLSGLSESDMDTLTKNLKVIPNENSISN